MKKMSRFCATFAYRYFACFFSRSSSFATHQHIPTLIFKARNTDTQMYKCTYVQMYRFSDAETLTYVMHRYKIKQTQGKWLHRCAVHRYTAYRCTKCKNIQIHIHSLHILQYNKQNHDHRSPKTNNAFTTVNPTRPSSAESAPPIIKTLTHYVC